MAGYPAPNVVMLTIKHSNRTNGVVSDKCPPTLRFHQRQPLVNTLRLFPAILFAEILSPLNTQTGRRGFSSHTSGGISQVFLNALDLFFPKPEPHLQTLLQSLVPPNLIIFYSLRSPTSVVATATRTSLWLSRQPVSLDRLLRQTSKRQRGVLPPHFRLASRLAEDSYTRV